jgi:hypothetical protein
VIAFRHNLGLGNLGVLTLADAIAKQENTPTTWNNPGALTAAPSTYCQTGLVPGTKFVQFCTPQDGWDALNNQIGLYASSGASLSSMMYLYAPPSENNTAQYINNLQQWTGLDPNASLISDNSLNLYDPSMGSYATTGPNLFDTTGTGTGIMDAGFLPNLDFSSLYPVNADGSLNYWMLAGYALGLTFLFRAIA